MEARNGKLADHRLNSGAGWSDDPYTSTRSPCPASNVILYEESNPDRRRHCACFESPVWSASVWLCLVQCGLYQLRHHPHDTADLPIEGSPYERWVCHRIVVLLPSAWCS